jgi:hypothetical protein
MILAGIKPLPPFFRAFFEASLTEKACLIAGLVFIVLYGWIADDAYIYFRYVDNLVVHNNGLVFNPGEYVEGFSSPAWLGVLAVLRFFRMNYWLAVRLMGMASFILFWYLAVLINRRFCEPKENGLILNFPLIYLTCTYGVMCYFTSGLESPLVLLEAAAYAAIFLFPSYGWLQCIIGLSPLVRHEFLLPVVMVFILLWKKNQAFPIFLFCVAFLGTASYTLFRIWYYADFFPNTFYLKDTVWLGQGLTYLYDAAIAYDVLPLLALMLVGYFCLRKHYGKDFLMEEYRILMIITAAPVLIYVIKIGGAYQHFRYLAFPFCLGVFASAGLAETLIRQVSRRHYAMIVAATACIALLFFSHYPRQLQQHPAFRSGFGYFSKDFLKISDAASSRFDGSHITPDFFSLLPDDLSYEKAVSAFANAKPGLFSHYWCLYAFLDPRALVIHSLGLTEPFLARTVMAPSAPGHYWGLEDMAKSIMELRHRYGYRPGVFAFALRQGVAPSWVLNNMQSISQIEQKIYNRHNFFENLNLALTPVAKIIPPPKNK